MPELTPEQQRQKAREFWSIVAQARPITFTVSAGGAVAIVQQIQAAARTDQGRDPTAPFVHGFARHLTAQLPGPVAIELETGWTAPAAVPAPPANEPLPDRSPPSLRKMAAAIGKLTVAIGVVVALRISGVCSRFMARLWSLPDPLLARRAACRRKPSPR